jgi:uncharacterized protein involved in cysteine biosynthesis
VFGSDQQSPFLDQSIFGMQSILPGTTSMKTFAIVLPVVTVSTVLAVFVLTGALRDMQKTVSENMPDPKKMLCELMLEHPHRRWRKEQFHDSRALRAQHSPWAYLAFLAELCFISIPVYEVKKAANLYRLPKRHPAPSDRPGTSMSQQHLSNNTTLASPNRPNTREANAKTLARQLIEVQKANRKNSRKGHMLTFARRARTALLTAARILLLCLWIPLLLLEYVALLFCCPFMGNVGVLKQPNFQRSISTRERLKHFFTAPLVFLDLDFSQFHTWRNQAEHEHRSPIPPTGPFSHALAPFPGSRVHPDPSRPGREPHGRSAQRLRHIMARPTFQAAYQQQFSSTPSSAAAVPAHQSGAHLRPRGYSDVEDGIPRRSGR